MRVALVFLAACSSATATSPVMTASPAPPAAAKTHSCADAALGLENATRGVRDPDRSVFDALREHCAGDGWPAATIDCFATMQEGDLGRCAKTMTDEMRDAVFAVLVGSEPDRAGIHVARARLGQLQVGVPACDRFVSAVSSAMTCEGLSVGARLQLGNETADFWSLPTSRLSGEAMQRMSDVCGESLASLERQAMDVGCML